MKWLRRLTWRGGSNPPQCWVVLIGASSDVASLSLVAVTGTEDEAWAMLDEAVRRAPGRANEAGTVPFNLGLTPAVRPGGVIACSEERPVFVVEEARSPEDGGAWFEVFASRDAAVEHARDSKVEAHVHDVVTNTWCGLLEEHEG